VRRHLIIVLLALLLGAGAYAQGPRNPNKGGVHKRTAIDRWDQMSPEERQRKLERLPPERRKNIEQGLEKYKQLTPEQRRDLRAQYERFSQLPPARQNQVRRLYRQLNQMPEDRRKLLRGEWEQLRNAPEADRRARMNTDEFRGKFSPHEQRMLRDLNDAVSPQ
jgi:hypothetical protein